MLLWPVKFAFRLILRLKVIAVSVLAGMAVAFYLQLRQQQQTWGIVPRDVERRLTGDELVDEADIVETRSLSVAAAPSAVWPWLVQMGFERGGWYSYDRLDMSGSSADHILPEFQDLAAGELVPTHPGGGFVAKIVEPAKALVLYLDTELARSQAEAWVSQHGGPGGAAEEPMPGGLQFAGALGGMTMPSFQASWAFVLEPEADGARTRLVERFRVRTADAGLPQKLGLPLMGLGVFAMTRKHMLGVKARAEGEPTRGAGERSNGAPTRGRGQERKVTAVPVSRATPASDATTPEPAATPEQEPATADA
jgi:hypothetical protein